MNTASTAPSIHQLVRERRLSPRQGAHLLEVRRTVRAARERRARKPITKLVIAVAGLVLAMLGFPRQQSSS